MMVVPRRCRWWRFPVELLICSAAEPEQILQFAQQLQMKAATNGMFAFPPIIDTKVDQPEVELVLDHDKVAALGLSMQQVSADLARTGERQLREPLQSGGPRLQGYSATQAGGTLESRAIGKQLREGARTANSCRSAPSRASRKTTPRALNRFQQLNAVKISGVAVRPLDEALKFFEGEAALMLPKGYTLDYTGESRQLRTEGNKFLPAFVLAVVLIFFSCWPRSSIASAIRSSSSSARAAGDVQLVDLLLPEVSESQSALLDGRLDHHVQHLRTSRIGDHWSGSCQRTAFSLWNLPISCNAAARPSLRPCGKRL